MKYKVTFTYWEKENEVSTLIAVLQGMLVQFDKHRDRMELLSVEPITE